MSAFSFPSPGGPGPISLRAPSSDSFCVSNIDERTASAAGGGDDSSEEGGGDGGGGGGAAELGQLVVSRRVGHLGCRPLSAVKSASEGLKSRTQVLSLVPKSMKR